jgi:arylsulfatase A-like enzyme
MASSKQRWHQLAIALILTPWAIGVVTAQEARVRPNILFLFTDDQRGTAAGALGEPALRTPNIDRLVGDGLRFDRAFIFGSCHGAVCAPSRAMLMTGRSWFRLPRTLIQPWSVPQEERGRCEHPTFPELLRRAGYRTFATGKQHNGQLLVERGFEQGRAVFLGGMAKHFGTPVRDWDPESGWSAVRRDPERYSSTVFADAVIEFLGEVKRGEDDHRPFFAYVSFTAPHDPRTAPGVWHEAYPPGEVELPPNFLPEHPFPIGDWKVRDEKLAAFTRTPEEVRRHLADYYAMVSATDAEIGRILAAIEGTGRAGNTLVVFAADNGLAVGQHGLMGKQNLYEHSARIPLVLAGPGIPENRRCEALVYLHDLCPTLLEYVGIPIPESVQSRSLMPHIRHPESVTGRDALLLTYSTGLAGAKSGRPGPGHARSLRTPRWKLILNDFQGTVTRQLFDLAEDPWEIRNLAAEPEQADRLAEMEKQLDRLRVAEGDPLPPPDQR